MKQKLELKSRSVNIKEKRGIYSLEDYDKLPYSVILHEVAEDSVKYWIAEIVELPGCKSHGSTVEEAVKNVQEAKKDWIIDSLEHGEEVPLPVDRDKISGKLLLRMPRSLHGALALLAESENLSLNQLIITILARDVGRLNTLNRIEAKLDRLISIPLDGSAKVERYLVHKKVGIP